MYENMNTFRPFFFFGIVKIDHRHTHTQLKRNQISTINIIKVIFSWVSTNKTTSYYTWNNLTSILFIMIFDQSYIFETKEPLNNNHNNIESHENQ